MIPDVRTSSESQAFICIQRYANNSVRLWASMFQSQGNSGSHSWLHTRPGRSTLLSPYSFTWNFLWLESWKVNSRYQHPLSYLRFAAVRFRNTWASEIADANARNKPRWWLLREQPRFNHFPNTDTFVQQNEATREEERKWNETRWQITANRGEN